MTTTAPETLDLTAGTWTIDQTHSEVSFTVRHLGLSKVRGRFNAFDGTVTIGTDRLASSVTANIDLSSIDTNNPQRDGHLRSSDFFDLATHPTMTFTSTAVTETSLNGTLTINGITQPFVFDLEFHGVVADGYGVTRAGFSATGQISRSDFGINFNAPVGLDGMLISDKVAIELEIEAVRAQ
jgi:polyisoprenoid-binding protein YceI